MQDAYVLIQKCNKTCGRKNMGRNDRNARDNRHDTGSRRGRQDRPEGRPQRSGSNIHDEVRAYSKRRRKKKRIMRNIMFAVLAVVLALIIGGGVYAYKIISSMQSEDIGNTSNPNLNEVTKQVMRDNWTIAVFGVDSRDGNVSKGALSDVIMICNVDKEGKIKLASVFRDTYLKIDAKGNYNKINQAYAIGGPKQAVQALNENLDLEIDNYMTFNWKSVAEGINILGGVDVDITKKEFKQINGFITFTVEGTGLASNHLKQAGMNHLDGVQAVAYSRLRLMDTDFQRTERQRKIIALCLEKAKQADWGQLNNILVTVLPQVKTDIGLNELIPVARNITSYNLGETSGFPFSLEDKYIGKKDCVIPTSLTSNVAQLHAFLYGEENYEPSATVRAIDAKITEAANGTSKNSGKTTTAAPKKSTAAATTEEETVTEAESQPSSESESEIDESLLESSEGETSESGGSGENPSESPSESGSAAQPTRPAAPGQGTSPETSATAPTTAPVGTVLPPNTTLPGYPEEESTSPVRPTAPQTSKPTAPQTSKPTAPTGSTSAAADDMEGPGGVETKPMETKPE